MKALIKISKEKHKFTPIQNGKLAFKSLKWIILGVHLIENYFFFTILYLKIVIRIIGTKSQKPRFFII